MRAQQYQTQLCGWSKLITPVENMFWACYIIVSILLILSFYNFYKNICSWSEAVDGGDFYFQFLDFLMPQAERCYVIMYNVQCWSPVPERSVPSWDMCFMEMFTQSVNNRAAAPSPAAAPLKTSAWNEGYPNVPEDFTITEKGPTRAFSWLKALSHLRHY